MRKSVTVAGHPVHPMLVVFPIGLWVFSLVSDAILVGSGNPIWSDIAFYTMAAGLVGALAAAPFGLLDYLAISDRRAAKTATLHMALNVTLVVLYGFNLFLRTHALQGASLPILLSVIGVAMLACSGWLGGELVYVHRLGVNPRDARREDSLPTRDEELRDPRKIHAIR
jgi:uncharacterized membrane protein